MIEAMLMGSGAVSDRMVLWSTSDPIVRVFETSSFSLEAELTQNANVTGLSYAENAKVLAVSTNDTIRIYDASTSDFSLISELNRGSLSYRFDINPSATHLLICEQASQPTKPGTFRIVEINTGSIVSSVSESTVGYRNYTAAIMAGASENQWAAIGKASSSTYDTFYLRIFDYDGNVLHVSSLSGSFFVPSFMVFNKERNSLHVACQYSSDSNTGQVTGSMMGISLDDYSAIGATGSFNTGSRTRGKDAPLIGDKLYIPASESSSGYSGVSPIDLMTKEIGLGYSHGPTQIRSIGFNSSKTLVSLVLASGECKVYEYNSVIPNLLFSYPCPLGTRTMFFN